MLFSRVVQGASRMSRVVRRGAADDGWLRKNIRVEEVAGLREATYKTYQLTPKEFLIHCFYLFIPGGILMYGVSNDMKQYYTRIGRPDINFLSGPLRDKSKIVEEEE